MYSKVIISMGLLVLVQTAGGAPPAVREEQDNGLKEVRRIQEITGPHGYNLQYATADGSVRVEKGGLVNGVWVVRGTVTSYKPDGKVHILYYIADNYGFRTTETLTEGERNYASGSFGTKQVAEETPTEVEQNRSPENIETKQAPEEKEDEDNGLGFRIGSGALSSLLG